MQKLWTTAFDVFLNFPAVFNFLSFHDSVYWSSTRIILDETIYSANIYKYCACPGDKNNEWDRCAVPWSYYMVIKVHSEVN